MQLSLEIINSAQDDWSFISVRLIVNSDGEYAHQLSYDLQRIAQHVENISFPNRNPIVQTSSELPIQNCVTDDGRLYIGFRVNPNVTKHALIDVLGRSIYTVQGIGGIELDETLTNRGTFWQMASKVKEVLAERQRSLLVKRQFGFTVG